MLRRLTPWLLLVLMGCTEGQKPEPLPRISAKTEAEKIKIAKTQIEQITKVLHDYRKNHEVPPSLDVLTQPEPDGKDAFLKADALIDPWGRTYEYNATGTKNKGEQPDVWCVTPAGETIGNWKEKN
jgi:hypothetical protein